MYNTSDALVNGIILLDYIDDCDYCAGDGTCDSHVVRAEIARNKRRGILTVSCVDGELPVSAYHPVYARQTQPAVERRRPHCSSATEPQTSSVRSS